MLWCTDIERLTFRTARAWNNAEYNGEFINADGEDMDGQDRERKAELFGNFDVSYDGNVSDNWRMYLLSDTGFGDEYAISAAIDPYVQDGYWLFDTAIRLHSANDRYELVLIGRNLSDEIVAYLQPQGRVFRQSVCRLMNLPVCYVVLARDYQ